MQGDIQIDERSTGRGHRSSHQLRIKDVEIVGNVHNLIESSPRRTRLTRLDRHIRRFDRYLAPIWPAHVDRLTVRTDADPTVTFFHTESNAITNDRIVVLVIQTTQQCCNECWLGTCKCVVLGHTCLKILLSSSQSQRGEVHILLRKPCCQSRKLRPVAALTALRGEAFWR